MTSPFKPLNGHSATASLQIYEKYCFIWLHILSHFKRAVHTIGASQAATSGKESAYQCRRYKRSGLNPWARKIPWRRKWQPIPVLDSSISWTEEPGGLQPMGLQRVEHNQASEHFTYFCVSFFFWKSCVLSWSSIYSLAFFSWVYIYLSHSRKHSVRILSLWLFTWSIYTPSLDSKLEYNSYILTPWVIIWFLEVAISSGPITSWEIDGETVETVSDFISGGSKFTADGDCSHEIKRRLLLGRKVMTNLDSILKSRDIILPTNTVWSRL